MTRTGCPVCGHGELERFLDLDAVPLMSTEFHPDREAALSAPRGDLHLALCRCCALVWNIAFDPSLIDYTTDYENSQHFSPAFQRFATDLAIRLGTTYDLGGRTVVEVGSGKGEFLALLAQTTGCDGVGFDPSFAGDVEETGIRIDRRYYDRDTAAELDAALVMARHVVEHLDDPVGFLASIRKAGRPDTAVYYEVPNAGYVFSDDGMWDLIYQHVGYFSRPTLQHALQRAGYEITDLRAAFHGQFLSIEGRPADVGAPEPDPVAVATAVAGIETFADRLRTRLCDWQEALSAAPKTDVVLWGAGAKGVAFLNLLSIPEIVTRVVDVNPRKVGRFVPGTGHRVEGAADLAGTERARVLLTNPVYEDEIRRELERLGITAAVEAV